MSLRECLQHYETLVQDLEDKIVELKKIEGMYLECSRVVIEKDAEIENYKHSIQTIRETLESLTDENKKLRGLIKIWA